jgi:hypothetical protein
MACAQSLIMLVGSLRWQIAAALIFVVYRANVFAYPPAFAGHVFGPRTVGRMTGLIFTLGSPIQFVISPALQTTLTLFQDNFRPLNLMEIVAMVPLVAVTFYMIHNSREPGIGMPHKVEVKKEEVEKERKW